MRGEGTAATATESIHLLSRTACSNTGAEMKGPIGTSAVVLRVSVQLSPYTEEVVASVATGSSGHNFGSTGVLGIAGFKIGL